ncbi:hypothetical protein CRENBAI_005739 [Crenichthys baileyi]|uniref:Uncharacterized protein n=1 Tax=Crenichthys baileyi TaxID=28760 RepID=A0AAV9QYP1_9TELE
MDVNITTMNPTSSSRKRRERWQLQGVEGIIGRRKRMAKQDQRQSIRGCSGGKAQLERGERRKMRGLRTKEQKERERIDVAFWRCSHIHQMETPTYSPAAYSSLSCRLHCGHRLVEILGNCSPCTLLPLR